MTSVKVEWKFQPILEVGQWYQLPDGNLVRCVATSSTVFLCRPDGSLIEECEDNLDRIERRLVGAKPINSVTITVNE